MWFLLNGIDVVKLRELMIELVKRFEVRKRGKWVVMQRRERR